MVADQSNYQLITPGFYWQYAVNGFPLCACFRITFLIKIDVLVGVINDT